MIKILAVSLILNNFFAYQLYHNSYTPHTYKPYRHNTKVWKNLKHQENLAKAYSKGNGETGAQISQNGSSSRAKGEKKAGVYTNFQNVSENFLNQKKRNCHTNIRHHFKNQNRIKTTGVAEANKNAFARSESSNSGTKIIAKGDEGSSGNTNQISHHKVYSNNFYDSVVGGKHHKIKKQFKKDHQSNGRTSTVVHGKGYLVAGTNRFKGSYAKAKGTCGTKSNVSFHKKEKNSQDNFETYEKEFTFPTNMGSFEVDSKDFW